MTTLAPEQTRKYRALKPLRHGSGTLAAGDLIEGQFGGTPIEQWPVEAIRACVEQRLIEPVPFEGLVTSVSSATTGVVARQSVTRPSRTLDRSDLMKRTPLACQIRTVLTTGARTSQELASELGASEDTVSRTLRRMHDNGKVVKLNGNPTGRGVKARWGLKAGS